MWERRSYDGALCTVKYIGPIEPWGDQLALGVEWDDAERGRNSGSVGGVQYFSCAVANAGSFIKASRAHDQAVNFTAAFRHKYLTSPEFEEIWLSRVKQVQTFDVEAMHQFQSAVQNLRAVALNGCCIGSIDSDLDFSDFSSLQRLDLSSNLLASFEDVVGTCSAFPALQTLRLDGNRFDFSLASTSHAVTLPNLRELSMNNNLLMEPEIAVVLCYFPQLHTLSLAFNRLKRIPSNLVACAPPSLRVLDLSNNEISSLEAGSPLPKTLTELYMSHCAVSEIPLLAFAPARLDVTGNALAPNDWASISAIGSQPVRSLGFNKATSADADTLRPFVIARCPSLEILDGTVVSLAERTDAELHTRSCVLAKTHPMLPDKVWSSILLKYGQPPVSSEKSIAARLIHLRVDNKWDVSVARDAPMYRLGWILARKAHLTNWADLALRQSGVGTTARTAAHPEEPTFPLAQTETVESCLQDGAHYSTVLHLRNPDR